MYSKMNKIALTLLMAISLFSGCSSSEGGSSSEVSATSLNGVAQKGPFVEGSKVSLCRLDEKLICTSDVLETVVTDEKGTYRFEKLPWNGLSKLSVSGYYFDEVTNKKSTSPVTITAIIEIKSNVKNSKNTNILTHMRAHRFKKLIDENKSKERAGKESIEDVKKLFNVHSDDFTALDLTDFTQGKVSVDAELLRISAAIAKSSNPIADLEKLMQIYNDEGILAVLESSLYKKLMQDAKDVDVKKTLKVLGVKKDVIALLDDADLKFTPIIITLADIDISIVVKGNKSDQTNFNSDVLPVAQENPQHGTVTYFKIGNEVPAFTYTSTDCFTGVDSFVYKVGDDYGRVNVTILPPQYTHVNDVNVTLFNNEVINSEYLTDNKAAEITTDASHGSASIFLVANEFMNYSYDPNDDFVGRDFFEYKVSDTIEGCSYSDTARVNFKVNQEVLPPNHAPTVSISPNADKTINVGDRVLLKSIASDEDGDELSISWKLKESTAADFTTVANFGVTGFNYIFNKAGTYLVVVEAQDPSGAKATANITVTVSASVVMTLADINISIEVKGQKSDQTNFNSDILPVAEENPQHGTVAYFKIGNEVPAFTYTSTDCFTGVDSFVYKGGDDYGRVNVTILPPQYTHVNDIDVTLSNGEVLDSEYLTDNKTAEITDGAVHGTSSIFLVANEFMHYSYDPDDDFIGSDFFEYKVSDTIEGCSYSDTARVNFTVLGSVHLFSWNDDVHGIELWRTDGTVAGTTMVKDIQPGDKYSYSNATPGVKIDGINYFAADDGNHSTELWRTDGTESGTYMLKDINPGLNDTSYPYDLSVIGDKFYFFALSGDNNGSNWLGNKGIWVSDGTQSGTHLVEALGDYSKNSYAYPGYLHALGDKLLFAKDDGAGNGNQWEPWVSDGINPSSKLKDISPGEDGSGFIACVEINSKCYSNADDYTHGSELWVTDGTSSGTIMVKDINENNSSTTRTEGSVPTNITVVGDRLFFVAFDTVQGISLFKSDGTQNGTVLVKDSFADENETDAMTRYAYRDNYRHFAAVGNTLYFSLDDGVHGQEIWKSDGTEAGTLSVTNFDNGVAPASLIEVAGTLYFWLSDDTTHENSGLYKLDESTSTATLIKAFSSDDFALSTSEITSENGRLYIEVIDYPNARREYWTSDGTEAGTFKLVDGEHMGG